MSDNILTDEDYKRLKDEFEPYVEGDPRILTGHDWLGIAKRLELTDSLLRRVIYRMKLINGPDPLCIHGPANSRCENHQLIREWEDFCRLVGKPW